MEGAPPPKTCLKGEQSSSGPPFSASCWTSQTRVNTDGVFRELERERERGGVMEHLRETTEPRSLLSPKFVAGQVSSPLEQGGCPIAGGAQPIKATRQSIPGHTQSCTKPLQRQQSPRCPPSSLLQSQSAPLLPRSYTGLPVSSWRSMWPFAATPGCSKK